MIVGLFPELLALGGIQRAGRHTAAVLAEYAAEKGMSCRLLSLNDPEGIHLVKVGGLEFAFRGFNRAKGRFVRTALREAIGGARLTVVEHPNLAPLARAMRLVAPGLRTVIQAHGTEVWTPLAVPRRWALRQADLVLAPSSVTARQLVTVQGVDEKRVRCLPWGLDPELGCSAAKSSQGASGADEFPDGKVVLTVGRQDRSDQYKGVDLLIEAMPRLLHAFPDLHLVVIGSGTDRPRLERMAQRLHIGEQTHFLGDVPGEKLAAAYHRCNVFAMPSSGEGFGLVFLEAMAFGKPVVGGAHGGTLDIIEDGVTGYLVSHGDADRLAQVLEHLLADDGLRKQIGRRAQERIREAYLFEHFHTRLTDMLEEITAGCRP